MTPEQEAVIRKRFNLGEYEQVDTDIGLLLDAAAELGKFRAENERLQAVQDRLRVLVADGRSSASTYVHHYMDAFSVVLGDEERGYQILQAQAEQDDERERLQAELGKLKGENERLRELFVQAVGMITEYSEEVGACVGCTAYNFEPHDADCEWVRLRATLPAAPLVQEGEAGDGAR